MAIVSDLLQLCRLCLVKDEVNVPIFEGESDDQQISLKISSCLPVTLSQDDRLPQKICSECCRKLDTLYEFRNSSVNAEKQLVTWLEELENQSKKTSEKMSIATESLSEKTIVKEEIDEVDENGALSNEAEDYILQQQVAYDKTDLLNDAADETGEPQPKRAKRAAALKALIHTQESEEDEEDIDEPEPITKAEEESEPSETDINESVDDTFAGGPSTSADDQPGPSGVGKSTEGPSELPLCVEILEMPKRPRRKIKREYGSDDEYKPYKAKKKDKKDALAKNNDSFPKMPRKRTWTCKLCGKVCSSAGKLQIHKRTHETNLQHFSYDSEKDAFICGTCFEAFPSETEAKAHLSKHNVSDMICKFCGEFFSQLLLYAYHVKEHFCDDLLRCPFCDYQSAQQEKLENHFNIRHLPELPYQCEICYCKFNYILHYHEHLGEHPELKSFICVVCSREFVFAKNLYYHQIRSHGITIDGQVLPTQCPVCLKIFGTIDKRSRHVENRHRKKKRTNEKNHLCDACGKGFSTSDKLKIHYRIHTGVKPYSCSYCEKKFSKKDYLVMHERIHSGERPYCCTHCGKCFNQAAPLRIHVRIHTGERPYVCQFCKTGFTCKGALTLHYKNCSG